MKRFVIMLFLLFLSAPLFADPVTLNAVLISPSENATRLTLMLDRKTRGNIKYLPNPDRVILDLEETTKHFTMTNARLGGSNIKSMTTSQIGHVVRFTFYMTGKTSWQVNFVPNKNGGVDLVVTLTTISTTPAPKEQTISQLKPQLPEVEPLLTDKLSTQKTSSLFTVVIDAGHGGHDPGAKGINGITEKAIVLAIAKKLAQAINATPNMHAILTRTDDRYMTLRERLKLARKDNADLFIAIHADAYFDDHATGAAVFALSQHAATSEAARWLAQQDNYSELDGVELDALKDRSLVLRRVLIDLAQTTTIQASLRLGNKILDALDDVSKLHHPRVEQAPFVVLKSPDIPSILVETGFITNPIEEKRLNDPQYQQKVARALLKGITEYVRTNPA